MTTEYFPFDAGAGASVSEDQWRKMARHWSPTGVLAGEADELAVSEKAAGAAMSVDVAAGEAWLRGHFFASDAVEELPVAAADPTDDRIDRIVLRADFVTNTVTLEVLEGTPDPAPTVPSLTQSAARWEIPLAQVLVQAAAVSILDADITDEREVVVTSRPVPAARVFRTTPQSIPNNASTAIAFASERFDTDEIHDNVSNNTRLTCKTAGLYKIGGSQQFAASGTGLRQIIIRLNGTIELVADKVSTPSGSTSEILGAMTLYDLAVNDYVEFLAFQTSGGALDSQAVANRNPEFWMVRVG